MAIVHVRIDERLIHGQVAMVWTNTVGASRIIVANDEAVRDDMIIAALKISKPAGVKLSILSRNKAVEKIGNGAYDDDRVFLIFQNVKDAAYCVEKGLELLDDTGRKIIEGKYFFKCRDYEVYMELGISKSNYYPIRKKILEMLLDLYKL